MSESDLPIRIPITSPWAKRFAFFVIIGYVIALGFVARQLVAFEWGARWIVPIIGASACPVLWITAVLLRRGQGELVLDDEGIWLQERVRKGIPWANVAGYALPAPSRLARFIDLEAPLKVWDHDGYTLKIPDVGNTVLAGACGPLVQELDRRVGLDGVRPVLAYNAGSLPERLRHRHGVLPAVELEPGIVYRYDHRKELRKALGKDFYDALAMLVPFLMMGFPSAPSLVRSIVLLGLAPLILCFSLPSLFQSIVLWKGLDDRFVKDRDGLWVLRRGQKTLLSPIESTKGTLMGQSLIVYGRGPFAYRMAPQFLEPDV